MPTTSDADQLDRHGDPRQPGRARAGLRQAVRRHDVDHRRERREPVGQRRLVGLLDQLHGRAPGRRQREDGVHEDQHPAEPGVGRRRSAGRSGTGRRPDLLEPQDQHRDDEPDHDQRRGAGAAALAERPPGRRGHEEQGAEQVADEDQAVDAAAVAAGQLRRCPTTACTSRPSLEQGQPATAGAGRSAGRARRTPSAAAASSSDSAIRVVWSGSVIAAILGRAAL